MYYPLYLPILFRTGLAREARKKQIRRFIAFARRHLRVRTFLCRIHVFWFAICSIEVRLCTRIADGGYYLWVCITYLLTYLPYLLLHIHTWHSRVTIYPFVHKPELHMGFTKRIELK